MNQPSKIEIIRHSFSHILAAAVLELYPETQLGVGPAIENGFYHDFDLGKNSINTEDLPKLEIIIKRIIKENHLFERVEKNTDEALKEAIDKKLKYRTELIAQLKEQEERKVSFYKIGDFINLCKGPHIESTQELNSDAFKLTKVAGAYWRGDENNPMLTRIYGIAFTEKKELDNYLKMMEEAEKRDHRKLGKELGLFVFSDLVGPGLPLYTHKGNVILSEIIQYSRDLQNAIGYQEVHTPNINKAELFKVSGHYEKYKDGMFKVASNYTQEEYFLKPMNCPQHTQIYAAQQRSYKDLPFRISDFANLYRDEKPGELSGLTRLRAFRQDDGHCFCREDQIKDEFLSVLDIIKKALKTYEMDYIVRLSLWDSEKPEQYLGDKKIWEKSQKILENILIESKTDYVKIEGEAAIYGPKMDFISKDSLGREWQLSTIQIDLIMPERFGLTYIDTDGAAKTPVMIHRAIIGSPERFLGILIEHYAGAFPIWLAPEQVHLLPIGKDHRPYAQEVFEKLKSAGIRAVLKDNDETLSKKIRASQKEKTPYMLVIGDKEKEAKLVSVRHRQNGDIGQMKVTEFIDKISREIKEKQM